MHKNVFIIFKVVVILNLLYCIILGEWTATFLCLFNFVLFFVSDYVKVKLGYSDFFQCLIYLFLIGSLIGGEVYDLYTKINFYDIILHTLSSFIVSFLFLYMFKYLGFLINKFLAILCVFSFAMMIAGIWEIFEFSVDRIFDRDMQKDTVVSEINSVLLSPDGNTVINKKINTMSICGYTINGYLDIGLYDTMGDMMCAVVGSILFIVTNKKKFLN